MERPPDNNPKPVKPKPPKLTPEEKQRLREEKKQQKLAEKKALKNKAPPKKRKASIVETDNNNNNNNDASNLPPRKRARTVTTTFNAANEPIRVHVTATHADHVRFEDGAIQPSQQNQLLPPPAIYVPPPREEHNAITLTDPDFRAFGDIVAIDTISSNPNELPYETLSIRYAQFLFASAVADRNYVNHHLVVPDEKLDQATAIATTKLLSSVPYTTPIQYELPPPESIVITTTTPSTSSTVDISTTTTTTTTTPPVKTRGRKRKVIDAADEARIILASSSVGRGETNEDELAKSRKSIRLLDPTLGIIAPTPVIPTTTTVGSGQPSAREQFHLDRRRRHANFYLPDPIPDPDHPYGLAPPTAYPTMKTLLADFKVMWEKRFEVANGMVEQGPRPRIERIDKAYRARYREHPLEDQRPCRRGTECSVYALASRTNRLKWAYNPPEFLLPSEEAAWRERRARGLPVCEANDGPVRDCIECLDWTLTTRVMQSIRHRQSPTYPLNTYDVYVGEGGYAREVMIPEMIDGVKTPIAGHVPYYDTGHREFETMTNSNKAVLREVHMDFHMRLSQMNACLGATKARPLVHANGKAYLPLDSQMVVSDRGLDTIGLTLRDDQSEFLPSLWIQFLRGLPMPVLADRKLVLTPPPPPPHLPQQTCPTPQRPLLDSRLPVVWLRRFFDLPAESITSVKQHVTLDPRPPPSSVIERALINHVHPYVKDDLYHFLFVTTGNTTSDHVVTATERDALLLDGLTLMANLVFTTFERTVAYVSSQVDRGILYQLDKYVATYGGSHANRTVLNQLYPRWIIDTFVREFAGMPTWIPPRPDTSIIWRTCMIRITATIILVHVLQPALAPLSSEKMKLCVGIKHKFEQVNETCRELYYQARLFMDTHLETILPIVNMAVRLEEERHDDLTAPSSSSSSSSHLEQVLDNTDAWYLELLTESVSSDNKSTVHQYTRLSTIYPQCNRIVCAEELPDMSPILFASNPWYDIPSKKNHPSLLHGLVHPLSKVLNQVCQRRGFDTILLTSMRNYPAIYHIIRLILYVALLGNLPRARSRPTLATRLRIVALFNPDLHGRHEETRRRIESWIHRHPMLTMMLMREYYFYVHENNGVMDDLRSESLSWIYFKTTSRHFNARLRNHLQQQVKQRGLRAPINWQQLEESQEEEEEEEVVDHCHYHNDGKKDKKKNNKKKNKDEAMNIDDNNDDDDDDDAEEEEEESEESEEEEEEEEDEKYNKHRPRRSLPSSYEGGEVQLWHRLQKDFNTKLFKETEIGLLLRKAGSVESKLTFRAEDYGWMRQDGRLEVVHICAWLAARRRQWHDPVTGHTRSIVNTGMLKLLGMTETSLTKLRDWLHLSMEYIFPDNGFKRVAMDIFKATPRDFLLFKTYWRLVDYYSDDMIVLRSMAEMRHVQEALRTSINLPGFVATPPRLGKVDYCLGCMTWSAPVIEASWTLLGQFPTIFQGRQKKQLQKQKQPIMNNGGEYPSTPPSVDGGEYPSTPPSMDNLNNRNTTGGGGGSGATIIKHPKTTAMMIMTKTKKKKKKKNKKKKKKKRRNEKDMEPIVPRHILPTDGRAACLNAICFDPITAKFYCSHADENLIVDTEEVKEEEEEEEVVDAMDIDETRRPPSTIIMDENNDGGNGGDDICLSLFDKFTCGTPMVTLDMMGAYRWLKSRLYGRCVYCGCVCEVLSVNMTNLGLSCGEHALTSEYPRWHRMWRHIIRPADHQLQSSSTSQTQSSIVNRGPIFPSSSSSTTIMSQQQQQQQQRLDDTLAMPPPVSQQAIPLANRCGLHVYQLDGLKPICLGCELTHKRETSTNDYVDIWTYDKTFKLVPFTLCSWHFYCIKSVVTERTRPRKAPPPLPLNRVITAIRNGES